MANFSLSVVAPDRTVFEDEVQSVILPGVNGYLGILARHEPMIIALRPGIMEFRDLNNQVDYVSVSGGFAEVSENHVIVLAQDAERATEIEVQDAERRLDEARRALTGGDSPMTTAEATAEIERASIRLRAAKKK